MNPDMYGDDLLEYDTEAYDTDYAADDVDDMLDALMESDDEDYSERKKRGLRGRRGRGAGRKPPTASGTPAYRPPTPQGPVTQTQLKEALARVGNDVRRNAEGIKTVNAQMGRLTNQVKEVVAINGVQGTRIGRLDRQMRLDGALDFATSFSLANDAGTLSLVPNLPQLMRGALKTGMVGGDPKGALSNPLLIGGIGFLLNNPQIIGNLLGDRT